MEFRGCTIEEVVRLIEDSGDSEIDEDPEFLLPTFLSSDEEHQQEDQLPSLYSLAQPLKVIIIIVKINGISYITLINTVFPRMLFALKLYSPSYSVRTTVWPECLLRSPSYCIRMVFKTLRTRDSNS